MRNIHLLFISLLFLTVTSQAQFLPFQGKVFTADDQPITGTHKFTFSITDGGVSWSEVQENVSVFQGIYAVVLGSQMPLPDTLLFRQSEMHSLDIQIDDTPLASVMLYRPLEIDPHLPDELRDGVQWEDIENPPPFGAAADTPVGTILPYAGHTIPSGWLECNGAFVSRNDYPVLFDALGALWGGDAAPNFRLPDLRGVFLRGVNGDRTDAYADPDLGDRFDLAGGNRTGVGSYQADIFAAHNHNRDGWGLSRVSRGGESRTNNGTDTIGSGTEPDVITRPSGMSQVGGNETRPKNAAVYFIIKAQ